MDQERCHERRRLRREIAACLQVLGMGFEQDISISYMYTCVHICIYILYACIIYVSILFMYVPVAFGRLVK